MSHHLTMTKTEHKQRIGLFASEPSIAQRFSLLAQNLDAEAICFNSEDDITEKSDLAQACPIFFLSGLSAKKDSELASLVQLVKFASPDCWLAVIVEKKIKPETMEFLKKSGANFILLEEDFVGSSKPEFAASLKLHGSWIPVKGSELKLGTSSPADLFYFMPLNRKFVPFMSKGQLIDESKHQKMLKAEELYIKRDQNDLFNEYIKINTDESAAGLASRCRRQYQSMTVAFKDLVLLLSDQSEGASFLKGKELYDRCHRLADDFMTSLGSVGEAWAVVNNAGFDDLTPVDRSPAIAATAGLISLMSGIGDSTEVFLAALFSDIGLLEVSPNIIMSWKNGNLDKLTGADRTQYESHPNLSVNRILSRKIPLPEKIKQIVLYTHERCDQKGFPSRPAIIEKILPESQLIQLAEMMDSSLKVDFGVQKKPADQVRKEILEREKSSLGAFQITFLMQVSKAL